MITSVCEINKSSLNCAKNLIESEELVAFPTETVYGLGGLATSDLAVAKIFKAKGRPSDNPLIVHVHKDYDLTKLVEISNDYVYTLIKAFMPGPLTLVLRSKGVVSSLVSCGLDTLAVRIPSHEGCQRFLKEVDLPIAAPSANISKHTSPVTASHVFNDLNGKISLILDGGKCSGGIESTVLDVTGDTPLILRSGLITREMIISAVGKCEYRDKPEGDKVRSPGMKYTHYKPKCETVLFSENQLDLAQKYYNERLNEGKVPYFLCDDLTAKNLDGNKLLLGETSEIIASNLYYKLLEGETVADVIVAVKINTGNEIDVGIMNRLEKACAPYKKEGEL